MLRFLTPRRALGVGILLALIGVAAVASGIGGGAGKSTVTAAQTPPRTHPLQTIFEAQSELQTNPKATFALLKRLGVDQVKAFLSWNSVAPDPLSHTHPHFEASSPDAYPPAGWAQYDTIVRDAQATGVGIDLALEAPAPLWATAPGVPPGTASSYLGVWEPVPSEFGSFVRAVAVRYSGHYKPAGAGSALPRVHFWSIWNEPNYGPQLAPQAIDQSTVEVSPAVYRRLLDAAWSALQDTGHEHDTVLIGEIAPRGQTEPPNVFPGDFSGMVPLRFIRALYCVDSSLHPLSGTAATERSCPSTSAGSAVFPGEHPALFDAGAFAFHPYPQGFAPNVRTPDEPDYADFPQLGQLEHTLDGAMAAYGSHTHMLLSNTEFGYQTNPPETTIARAVSPDQAAAWTNLAEYMSWRDPRVASWDQYLLSDPPPGTSSFDTGLEFYGGKHKATFNAFRMPVFLPKQSAANGHALEVWGCVRPAHYLIARSRTPQVADVEFRPGSGGAFRTVKRVTLVDPYGYFDAPVTFPSSGQVRIAWSYPHEPSLHSRTVQIVIR